MLLDLPNIKFLTIYVASHIYKWLSVLSEEVNFEKLKCLKVFTAKLGIGELNLGPESFCTGMLRPRLVLIMTRSFTMADFETTLYTKRSEPIGARNTLDPPPEPFDVEFKGGLMKFVDDRDNASSALVNRSMQDIAFQGENDSVLYMKRGESFKKIEQASYQSKPIKIRDTFTFEHL